MTSGWSGYMRGDKKQQRSTGLDIGTTENRCATALAHRLHHGLPEGVPLAWYEGDIQRDAVYEPGVALLECAPDVIGCSFNGERGEHLVGDEGRHLAPLLLARHRTQFLADLFPAVGFEDGAVGRCRGVERDLGPNRLSPLVDFLSVLSGDDKGARRERNLLGVAVRFFS